jgi:tetratricopeptide (TPR) repeat protein
MPNSPRIALCLIAGNEEAVIHRALDSAFSITDTVIVVRAIGALPPDKTMQIAAERGCICSEYRNSPACASWPFVDDFAAARNKALRLAADVTEDGDWLMWMDCDDIVEPGTGAAIREAVANCAEEWILCPYHLPQHGKDVLRERLFRRGTAAWMNGVHEKCVPVTSEMGKNTIKVRVRKDIRIVHEPLAGKSGSQERNLNILLFRYQEMQHTAFYLHYEHFLLGKREEAIKYGLQALRLDNLDGVYRYEVLLNLAMLAEKNEHGQDLLQRAIKLCADRREAHHLLALLQMDAGQTAEAVKTAEHCLTIGEPKIYEWTHRPDIYGWKGYATLAWAHRANGDEAKAKEIEDAMLARGDRPRISLLHATRGRWSKAINAMSLWMGRATNPEAVEHIFAIDEDDAESRDKLSRFRHVIAAEGGYSVGAWNTAAKVATGDVLIQIADDFEPPLGWDKAILDALGGDLFAAKVMRVSDGLREDGLITMAIVTRRWYETHGLFDASFLNVYSDNDLTTRAEKAGAIINAKHLVFQHVHPVSGKVPMDATYERGNDLAEYARAEALFHAKHR